MIEKSIFKDGANKNLTHPNNERGITLIALVITIIVLLILAGVAISMLSGENGVLRQAANSKTSSDIAKLSESIKLSALTGITNKEHKLTQEGFIAELEKAGYKVNGEDGTVTKNNVKYAVTNKGAVPATISDLKREEASVYVNTKLEDDKGHIINIPMNFNISSESPLLVTEGMIIEDSEENQYVWIPVFTKDQYNWGVNYSSVTSETDYTNIKTALKSYTATYGADSKYTDNWYGNSTIGKYGYNENGKLKYYTNGNMTSTEYNTLYNDMLKSIYNNRGFYIGRYEMGIKVAKSIDEANNITRLDMTEYIATNKNEENTAPSIKGMTAPISKANAVPYTYITQSQAQMLAKKLGEKNDYSNVTSSIMFGIQWEAICVFIEKFDQNEQKLELLDEASQSQWLTSAEFGKLWGNGYSSTFIMNRGYVHWSNSRLLWRSIWRN